MLERSGLGCLAKLRVYAASKQTAADARPAAEKPVLVLRKPPPIYFNITDKIEYLISIHDYFYFVESHLTALNENQFVVQWELT